jgi:hypothetical protein
MCTITLLGGILLALAHTTCTTTADLDKPKPGMALKPAGAIAQEPMFPQQYPVHKGVQAPPPGRSQLEELTSYPASMVAPSKHPIDPNKVPPGWSAAVVKSEPTTPQKVVLFNEAGGYINEHRRRFGRWADQNNPVEVLGDCASACTLVVAEIKKENLCFGPEASLKFHQATNNLGQLAPLATEEMYNSYPADIRAWIDRKGGWQKIPISGWLYLDAPELWKMGYRKCP